MARAEAELIIVRAAIDKISGGSQSYTVQGADGGVTYTRADLARLYERETLLLTRITRAGGIRMSQGVPR